MTKLNKKVEELLTKHPHLSQEEAIKILAEKNERKKQKRAAKTNKGHAKKLINQEDAPDTDEA
ncbi:hypothetical protein [Paraglaciecola sp. L3A3]|uniref:hypothetical protein n=1 Tax=Paraglaciecola sp. L3A3 TaxID=2686358 RepID=UPI00131E4D76|nr:hypothetical protein [Paraglaciecola sp. L3A3]